MLNTDDMALVQAYASEHSEEAFAAKLSGAVLLGFKKIPLYLERTK